jgi:hypothetical protein
MAVDGAHLVGSVPLADAEAVFRMASRILGEDLSSLPDGETGARSSWIGWQYAFLAESPLLEHDPEAAPRNTSGQPEVQQRVVPLRLVPGRDPSALHFDSLGYADHALASYAVFDRLRQQGVVPRAARFQVSVATPHAPVWAWVSGSSRASVVPAYEAAILREVQRIVERIPHDSLAIQWDVMTEVLAAEGLPDFEAREDRIARLHRLGNATPTGVKLGYHLCYGDPGHRHIIEPKDTAVLTELANSIASGLRRDLDWLHLPVPRARNDAAYFAPLRGLRLPSATRLVVGLVHFTDGVAGTLERVRAAQKVVPRFAIATECGFGRRPPETIEPLLAIHREVIERG